MIGRLEIPDELVEAIAARAAELVLERLGSTAGGSEFLDVDEAAAFLRCGRQRIYDLRSSGRLSRHADGSRVLVARSELEQLVAAEARRVATALPQGSRGRSGSGAAA